MRRATSFLNGVLVEKTAPHLKTSDETGAASGDVPVA
jgi:hypothetical protein